MTGWLARFEALACVATIGYVAACSGSTSSGSGNGAVSQSDFPGAFAAAVCSNFGSCCTTRGLAFSLSTCEQLMVEAYRHDAESSSYDEQASGACLSAAAVAAQQCNLDAVLGPSGACGVFFHRAEVHGKLGDACNGTCWLEGTGESCTFIGANPDGGAPSPVRCFGNEGLFCNGQSVCEQLPSVGQPCAMAGCEPSAFCNDSNVCEARRPEGADCTWANQCASGLYCPAAFGVDVCPPQGGPCTGTSGPPYCTKQLADGAPCQDDLECAEGSCASGVCGGASDKLLSYLCAP